MFLIFNFYFFHVEYDRGSESFKKGNNKYKKSEDYKICKKTFYKELKNIYYKIKFCTFKCNTKDRTKKLFEQKKDIFAPPINFFDWPNTFPFSLFRNCLTHWKLHTKNFWGHYFNVLNVIYHECTIFPRRVLKLHLILPTGHTATDFSLISLVSDTYAQVNKLNETQSDERLFLRVLICLVNFNFYQDIEI